MAHLVECSRNDRQQVKRLERAGMSALPLAGIRCTAYVYKYTHNCFLARLAFYCFLHGMLA